jgi:hypothetical protein
MTPQERSIQELSIQELGEVGAERFTAPDYRPGKLTHIVLFRFNPDASPSAVQAGIDRFLGLADSRRQDGEPYILSIEAGAQNSAEGAAEHGYDHGFVVTFGSEGDRNFYVGRPIVTDDRFFDHDHDAFKDAIAPIVAGVLVFDFTP